MHTSGTTRVDLDIFALSRAVRGSEGGNILGEYNLHDALLSGILLIAAVA